MDRGGNLPTELVKAHCENVEELARVGYHHEHRGYYEIWKVESTVRMMDAFGQKTPSEHSVSPSAEQYCKNPLIIGQ